MNINRFTLLQLTAGLVFSLVSLSVHAQMLANVTAEECVRGDCINGSGRMELTTEWGKVRVTWWTHKIRNLHRNDFIMAAKTDRLYQEAGVEGSG